MLRITQEQLDTFNERARAKTVEDIVTALNARYSKVVTAVRWGDRSESDRVRLVEQIVKTGAKHGFVLRGDMYSLVEACVALGPSGLLSDPVLQHPELAAAEKVKVMIELFSQDPLSTSRGD